MNDHRLRIGILGSYGGLNIGDEAILEVIIKLLRTSMDPEITIFSKNAEDTLRRHKVEHALDAGKMVREQAKAEIEKLDLLILGGGGLLYDEGIENYLREVGLAHELNIPVMVYAISAGPLKDPEKRKLAAKHLNLAAAITVRDLKTKKLLEEVGVQKEIVLTADPALLLEPAPLPDQIAHQIGLDSQQRFVGFSVREPGPAAQDIDIEHYHALLANTADFMVARFDAKIVFVPMEQKVHDAQHSHAVIARMQHAQQVTVLKGEFAAPEVLSLIGQFQFCVGMRLHFLIFSAIQNVPFAALPYASKIEGFLADLEMPMPPLKEISTGGLIAYVDRSWDMKDSIRQHISERLEQLKDRSRQNNRILLDLLKQHVST